MQLVTTHHHHQRPPETTTRDQLYIVSFAPVLIVITTSKRVVEYLPYKTNTNLFDFDSIKPLERSLNHEDMQ